MKVKDIMTTNVRTITSDKKLGEVVSLMCIYRYSGIPVVDDGKLVVANRWFLKTEFDLFPWEGTLEEIKRLGHTKGIAIPTFDDTCRLIKKRPQAVFNVEIKSSDTLLCRTAKAAMAVIKHHGIDDQVIVSSFDINTLLTTRFFHPTIETAYLFRQEDRVLNVEDKKRFTYKLNTLVNRSGIKGFLVGVDTLHPEIKLFPEQGERLWIKAARVLGIRVNAWTVDSEEDFEKALGAGVAVIISDRPEHSLGGGIGYSRENAGSPQHLDPRSA